MRNKNMWDIPYLSLELFGGTLTSLVNDDEDMPVIRWPDGMGMDVCFMKQENLYCLTTVADEGLESRNHPLSVIEVKNRADLPTTFVRPSFHNRPFPPKGSGRLFCLGTELCKPYCNGGTGVGVNALLGVLPFVRKNDGKRGGVVAFFGIMCPESPDNCPEKTPRDLLFPHRFCYNKLIQVKEEWQ